MKKSIKLATIGGTIAILTTVGGVTMVKENELGELNAPMTGVETIEQPVETVVEPVIEATPEVTETPVAIEENMSVVAEPEPTPEEKCNIAKSLMIEKYGTLDFFEAVSSLPGAKNALERLGITNWETIKNEFYVGDVMRLLPKDNRSFVLQIAPLHDLTMLVSLDKHINDNC